MPSPSEITVIQGKSSVGLISYLGKKALKVTVQHTNQMLSPARHGEVPLTTQLPGTEIRFSPLIFLLSALDPSFQLSKNCRGKGKGKSRHWGYFKK